MKIIISPAKQMRVDTDTFTCIETPVFLEKTEILKSWIRGLSKQIRTFNWSGYSFDENRSSESEYVFVRRTVPLSGE